MTEDYARPLERTAEQIKQWPTTTSDQLLEQAKAAYDALTPLEQQQWDADSDELLRVLEQERLEQSRQRNAYEQARLWYALQDIVWFGTRDGVSLTVAALTVAGTHSARVVINIGNRRYEMSDADKLIAYAEALRNRLANGPYPAMP